MPTTALERPSEATAVTPDQLELIRRTIAKDATPDELQLYLYDCHRQGVHPLDKLIHFTKRGGKYTPVTSIDFMRIRAADSGEMAGSDDPVFELRQALPIAATVTVYRLTQGQRFAYTATARWTEYKPAEDFMWRKMPHTMLGKCAEALALRKGFPRQLAGLYAKEEMDQADAPTPRPAESAPTAMPAAEAGLVDMATGEVVPAGFDLIDDCRIDGEWHHIDWGRDAQGATVTYKTKLMKVGNRARVAFNEQVPVRLHAKRFPFLDRVERLDDDQAPAVAKGTPDDVPEQGF